MTIESGKCYIIINKKSETVVDLDLRDNQTVQCWTPHNGPNQKWEFNQVEPGGAWSIRNVEKRDAFMSYHGEEVDNGTKILGLNKERLWHIWKDKLIPDGYRIFVPNTQQNLDLADFGNCAEGTPVQLWKTWEDAQNQVWGVKEVEKD